MASYLKVDLAALGELAGSLRALQGQFDSAGDIGEAYAAAIGSGDLNGAIHDFATNWKYHREKLTGSMDSIAKMAQQGHDTYQQVDDELARSITTDGGGAPGSGRAR